MIFVQSVTTVDLFGKSWNDLRVKITVGGVRRYVSSYINNTLAGSSLSASFGLTMCEDDSVTLSPAKTKGLNTDRDGSGVPVKKCTLGTDLLRGAMIETCESSLQ